MTNPENELGLDDYVGVFKRRWRAVFGSVVVVLAVVVAFTLTRDKTYESQGDILIMTESTTGLFSFGTSVEGALVRNPVSELQLALSEPFRDSAEATLGFDSDVTLELVAPPGSDNVDESSVLRITARDSDPDKAHTAAQAYAENYIRLRAEADLDTAESNQLRTAELLDRLVAERAALQAPIIELREQRLSTTDPITVEQLNRQIADLESDTRSAIEGLTAQINEVGGNAVLFDQTIDSLLEGNTAARVLNAADRPSSPVSPNVPRNIIVAILIGLVIGLFVATLRELFDSSLRNAAEVSRRADTPYIAAIPELDRVKGAPGGVASFDDLPASHSKAYDVLLNSLWLGAHQELGCIAVTGDHAGVGITQTAINLAHVGARRGTRVCVVDAAFATPGVASRFGLDEDHPGFADVLGLEATLDDAILNTSTDGLDVIGTGKVLQSTFRHLRSNRLGQVLTELSTRYGLVVIDVPPVAGHVDARAVAAECDGVVVLYDPETSQLDEIVGVVQLLRSSGALPLGLVANRT